MRFVSFRAKPAPLDPSFQSLQIGASTIHVGYEEGSSG